MCSIGGIDCVPKWKHVLTPSGICLELKLQHDPDFQALGKLTLNSNVLGLIVSTNLRSVSYSNNCWFLKKNLVTNSKVIGHMDGTRQELVLSCITITSIKESSLTAVIILIYKISMPSLAPSSH